MFLAATIDPDELQKDWLLFNTFSFFDTENKGKLNVQTICQALKKGGKDLDQQDLKSLIQKTLNINKSNKNDLIES